MFDKRATTKGGIILENIKIGDIHYEYEYGFYMKSKVITIPIKEEREDGDHYWSWQSESLSNGKIINYGTSEKNNHYGPNLYDYEAYMGCKQI